VGLVRLTVFPEARAGLCFPSRTNEKIFVILGLVSLTIFPEANSLLDFPLRTTKKAFHRGFGQLDCIT
jgi:hypothetical protein